MISMRKLLLSISIAVGLTMIASPALAATLNLSSTGVNVAEGETFTLTVSQDPQSEANYTTKIDVSFPADLLEVQSFNFADGWMPLSQSGYDLVDNSTGHLAKTAGYPGGIAESTTFGTVTFLAKADGNAVVEISSDSVVYDADNNNILTGLPVQTSVSISEASTIVDVEPTPTDDTGDVTDDSEIQQPEGLVQQESTEDSEEEQQAEVTPTAQAGEVAGAQEGNQIPVWPIVAVAALLLAGIAGFVYYSRRVKSKSEDIQ